MYNLPTMRSWPVLVAAGTGLLLLLLLTSAPFSLSHPHGQPTPTGVQNTIMIRTISIATIGLAMIGTVAAQGCAPTTCQDWDCTAPNGADSWCKCYDENAVQDYTLAGCTDSGDPPCVCPATPTCVDSTTFTNSGPNYMCGNGHGSATCPTLTAPSQWCNNPNYPARMSNSWCTTHFCEQCGHGYGIVYVGCSGGVQAVANSCQACGLTSRGPCQPGVLPNDAKCHPTGPNSNMRLSFKNNVGCGANLCKGCGVLNSKPCNNGDGLRVCDAGLGIRKWGDSSEQNCIAQKATCPPSAADWAHANALTAAGAWSGSCSTLPEVGGVFYNRVPGTAMTPDVNSPFVHGSTFVF